MSESIIVNELAGRLKQAGVSELVVDDRLYPEAVKDHDQQLQRVGSADHQFIEHLLSPELSDSDPSLTAIGYELEALLSIYPSSLKLSHTSRPASPLPMTITTSTSSKLTDAGPSSASSSWRSPAAKRMSQSWDNAVFDASIWTPGERIRYEILIPVWDEGEVLEGLKPDDMPSDIPKMRILVSLPPTYPQSSAPQLQLLGRYLGNFAIDAGLSIDAKQAHHSVGDITRTFIASTAVPFSAGDVCVFDGLTYAQSVARKWYTQRLLEGVEGEKARDEVKRKSREKDGRLLDGVPISPMRGDFGDYDHVMTSDFAPLRPNTRPTFSYSRSSEDTSASADHRHPVGTDANGTETPSSVNQAKSGTLPHFTIHVSQPIVDRKSTFLGHAIRVTDEREVPLVIHEILSDKKVAKAAHPAMFAYRIGREVGGVAGKVTLTDCDDDGESAAGSRLSHLLEILEVENVLVVVSRWYGGVLLGADRFKHINQAARDALEVGGFLDSTGGAKGRRR